jgi:hypothetical protein
MKCYCLEILRAKFGDQVDGKCLRESCGRWRREKRKKEESNDTRK